MFTPLKAHAGKHMMKTCPYSTSTYQISDISHSYTMFLYLEAREKNTSTILSFRESLPGERPVNLLSSQL